MSRWVPALLLLLLLSTTGCVRSQVRDGQQVGDNPQTRSAIELLAVRDCRGMALASENDEVIRDYTLAELEAMTAYRESGSELVVSQRPLSVDMAMAYARLALLAVEEDKGEEHSRWRELALAQAARTPDVQSLSNWDSLATTTRSHDEERRQGFEDDGHDSVPPHCAVDYSETTP